jgi:hypothetical protein
MVLCEIHTRALTASAKIARAVAEITADALVSLMLMLCRCGVTYLKAGAAADTGAEAAEQ